MYSCVQIFVILQRRVGNQLVNTYLPTTCILIIIYLTHYFKLEHYDTRIMVALTGAKNRTYERHSSINQGFPTSDYKGRSTLVPKSTSAL